MGVTIKINVSCSLTCYGRSGLRIDSFRFKGDYLLSVSRTEEKSKILLHEIGEVDG